MFSNPLRSISNNIFYYERHSFFCSVCKQRFLTEKNFNRHITSRKHIRQMQIIHVSSYRVIRRPHGIETSNGISFKLDLLPNDVIEELINDLTNQVDQKENFFNEIDLVDDNQLMATLDTKNSAPQTIPASHSPFIMETAPIFHQPKLINLSSISAKSPCLACFQSLDTQQNFNEHMLKAHFNLSIGVNNKIE